MNSITHHSRSKADPMSRAPPRGRRKPPAPEFTSTDRHEAEMASRRAGARRTVDLRLVTHQKSIEPLSRVSDRAAGEMDFGQPRCGAPFGRHKTDDGHRRPTSSPTLPLRSPLTPGVPGGLRRVHWSKFSCTPGVSSPFERLYLHAGGTAFRRLSDESMCTVHM